MLLGIVIQLGNVRWGVKEVAPWASNWWGNGGDWAGSAASQGYAVGSTPVTGSNLYVGLMVVMVTLVM